MSWLINTNVVSEMRKGSRADPAIAAWFADMGDDDVYTSVLVIGEIRRGIASIRRRDHEAAQALERWLARVIEDQGGRVLPIDLALAEAWGRLNVPGPLSVVDGLLAVTAKVHGLTLVTRNVGDVERSGVPCLNPFAAAG